LLVIHPDEAQDGHAVDDEGFCYRLLFIDPGAVSAVLGAAATPFVRDVVSDDPALAGLLKEAFADFPRPLEPIAADAIVGRVAELLSARCDSGTRPRKQPTAHRAVERARDYLIAEAPRIVASLELERVSGLDRFALARHFRAAYGTSPHRFQVGRRLARAQSMIARGTALSEVAAATGFADQSHLTRHFAARFGLPPGRWAALSRT
jgi:AraC-like DNA-binding protein